MLVSPGRRYRCMKLLGMLALGMMGMAMLAQQPESAPAKQTADATQADSESKAKPYVLHVYENLMQIPTVVVTSTIHKFMLGQTVSFDPIKGLTKDRFRISLDSGKLFQPPQMRIEGDDPITVGILIDLRNHTSFLLPTLGGDLQHMAATSLLGHDHISLYTLDCELVRKMNDLSANSEELTAKAFVTKVTVNEAGKKPSCAKRTALIDAIGLVVRDISQRPGRKIVLVVSRGEEEKSVLPRTAVKRYAAGHSTAIFGLIPLPELGSQSYERLVQPEDAFEELCQLSGGLVLSSANMELRNVLKGFIDIVRQRYILEFPRPSGGVAGEHEITVTLPKLQAMIRPAGVAVPLDDPSIAKDPMTVPTAPSPATYGKRTPIGKP